MQPFDVYPLMNIQIQKSLGSYVWDNKGQRYLDFYGGHAVISIGHGHPHYIKRIKDQLDKVGFYSNFVQNALRTELAEKLGHLSGYPDYKLFLVNSGAEAIENALKLASFKNRRTKVISFKGGFHGRTAAAVHITDNKKIAAPVNKGFESILLPFNEIAPVRKEIAKGDVAAVVIEGIQGIGGIRVPTPEFLQNLQTICKEQNTLLIVDEIQSGYGRTGLFFAHQYAKIQPDLITVAKGMGNGFPIGGVLISPDFESKHGLLGTTFGGTQLACAAGLAVLEIIEQEELLINAIERGDQLKTALSQFSEIKEIRGRGCMIGVEMPFPIKAFRKLLIEKFNVFTGASSEPHTLRILPPLSVSYQQIEAFIHQFNHCLSTYQKQL